MSCGKMYPLARSASAGFAKLVVVGNGSLAVAFLMLAMKLATSWPTPGIVAVGVG